MDFLIFHVDRWITKIDKLFEYLELRDLIAIPNDVDESRIWYGRPQLTYIRTYVHDTFGREMWETFKKILCLSRHTIPLQWYIPTSLNNATVFGTKQIVYTVNVIASVRRQFWKEFYQNESAYAVRDEKVRFK